jgi:predicted glycogen debranching enzyme
MTLDFGREICGDLDTAEVREWLVTNSIGGYASGTVANLNTRGYHGLLVAALKPPLERTLLLSKLDETAEYDGLLYPLFTNRWSEKKVEPHGYKYIENFYLEGTIPVWRFVFGDAVLEKRIWMQQGANTTYIRYDLARGTQSLKLSIKALVNYRDYHSRTNADSWRMRVDSIERGVRIVAFAGAVPFYLLADRGLALPVHQWYYGFELARERDRGLYYLDDNLHATNFLATIEPGESLTLVASTESSPDLNSKIQLEMRRAYEQKLLATWQASHPDKLNAPDWIEQLILAADQFIVDRPLPNNPNGKTIIAGYHWFSDWGRDTTIALPGLTLATGRPEIARSIIYTFSRYVSQGMLPNRFPDDGAPLTDADYNTVDAALWYFEAVRAYHAATGDDELLNQLFPILAEIIDWHCQGTRYNIKLDLNDGLLYAGSEGVQLTWMDAKVGNWVVTPRIGKPVEINALWYNALRSMSKFSQHLGKTHNIYETMAEATFKRFRRFWNASKGYCFDVLDTPDGNDCSLRPNQILAVSLPESPLTPAQQHSVVEICARALLTSHGLRSLDPKETQYQGCYTGNQFQRDRAYHQGTVWGWLLGPFVLAHLRVFNDRVRAKEFLEPLAYHLRTAGVGSISEIFDGDAPMQPKGCIAQAWSVAETLRAWLAIENK